MRSHAPGSTTRRDGAGRRGSPHPDGQRCTFGWGLLALAPEPPPPAGRRAGSGDQLLPHVSSHVCDTCPRDPCHSSWSSPVPRWQSCCGCWGWPRTQGRSPAPLGSKAHPARGAVRVPRSHHVGGTPRSLAPSSAQNRPYPEVHPPSLTFFLTARGCSVARVTRSFCSAPASIASTCTLGLLQGEEQRGCHQQSGARQGGMDAGSAQGSTSQRHDRGSIQPDPRAGPHRPQLAVLEMV